MISTFVWVLRIYGCFMFLAALLVLVGDQSVGRSLMKSQKIEGIFGFAAGKVEDFYGENRRYPTSLEFEAWRDELSEFGMHGKNLGIQTQNFPAEVIREFGEPTEDSFVLRVWRGEWTEFYSSWKRSSTLPKTKSEYYWLGNMYSDLGLSLFVSVCAFLAAHLIAKKKRITSDF